MLMQLTFERLSLFYNKPGRIQDRVALITGASSGLGREIARCFASEGARICLVDIFLHPRSNINPATGKADDVENRTAGESAVEKLERLYGKERFLFVKADVTTAFDVEAAVAKCVAEFGRLDIMMNNAGIAFEATYVRPLAIHELSEEDRDKTMAINVKGVFLGCKYALAQMLKQENLPGVRDRGWVVNTASIMGMVACRYTPAYTTSKGAVCQLTKQVALDYASERIHCNSICPGFLRTAMTQNLQNDPQSRADLDKAHPFGGGGMGSPSEVARAALFLVTEDAAWITGINLPIDGGYTIR